MQATGWKSGLLPHEPLPIVERPDKSEATPGKSWSDLKRQSMGVLENLSLYPPIIHCSLMFRSRGSTGRSRSRPMGDLTCKSTRLGNLLCARTLVILWLCAAQSVWFVLEQPSSSLMELHCLFQRFIRRIPLRKLTIRMADFGSATAKPTILYSSFLLMKFRVTCIYF